MKCRIYLTRKKRKRRVAKVVVQKEHEKTGDERTGTKIWEE
jgi:hypothetical protein